MTLKQKINLVILLAIAILLIGCPPFDSKTNVSDSKSTEGAAVIISGPTDVDEDATMEISAITTNGNGTTKYIAVSQDTDILTVSGVGPTFLVTPVTTEGGATNIVIIDTANNNALSSHSVTVNDTSD